MFTFKKNTLKRFDWILFITVIILASFGIMMILSATASYDNSRFVKVQSFSLVLGIIAIIFLVIIDYRTFGKFYIPIYIVSNLLLVIVLIFGVGDDIWGAKRALAIGNFVFQPAEIAKVGVIISLAKLIDKNKHEINKPLVLLKIIAFAAIPMGLILMQPDLGTTLVFAFFIGVMLFIAGLDIKYFGYVLLIGLICLPLIWMSLDNYQKIRITGFLNPEEDTSGSVYQAREAKIAVGSGKVFGRGLFQGVQTQYGYIPEKQTDMIFAVVGEELGFIGGLTLFLLYFIMLYRLIKIAKDTEDLFGSLIVTGITAMFLFHIWENIGMTIGLMPITGIPLPFMSYGGTFLLVNMISIGISLSVAVHKEGLTF